MRLHPGLYEQLVTRELASDLADPRWHPTLKALDALGDEAADELLARHLYGVARRALSGIGGLEDKLRLINRLIADLSQTHPAAAEPGDHADGRLLLALQEAARVGVGGPPERPGIPLRHSELIVNGPRDLRVGREILRELPSTDRVDLLMSFVKWSGFVELREGLAGLGGRLRVLTTTYLGASELEAVEGLVALGADVRISYDERRTRLHAKAWLFHRDSGYGTALIGSSNLSSAALRDGCEWNVRLSERDNPGLLAKFRATFDQYWEDPAFEPFDRQRFIEAAAPRRDLARDALARIGRLRPLPHQVAMLDALTAERAAGHHRNLVVAATGTGKTVVAALDYARQVGRPRLLFVAQRDRILDQSLATFRLALGDGSFGEKLTGRDRPVLGTHVFASIQSLHADRLAELGPEAYDVVIVDEFHHAAAPTYEALLSRLRPRILLGLTATPERADGADVLRWFDGRVAASARLWDALDQGLLCPFQYFVVHDGTDLSQIDFRGGRYDVGSLERLYTADAHRARQILRALGELVRSPRQMRALGFCVSIAHARYMQAVFDREDLPSAVVDAETPRDERERRISALERGDLCCLFTVDVFNEGVDVPRVDTLLLLRPTESATVFLQQLGRGLRLHEDKACLTVLDFVGNARQEFRFDLRFRALLGGGTRAELADAIEAGFPRLPSGCAIQLEAQAQREILDNIRRALRRWTALADELTPEMTVGDLLDRAGLQPDELYRDAKTHLTRLRALRGFGPPPPDAPGLRALHRLLHVDDPDRLSAWRAWLSSTDAADPADPLLRMLFGATGHEDLPLTELPAALAALRATPGLGDELPQLLAALDDRRRTPTIPLPGTPLHVHARYTRAEVMAALDLRDKRGALKQPREGVVQVEAHRCDLLFVTLDKDEADFSPTTLYDDYPITPTSFHWQSQSATREDSTLGLRYRRPPPGWRILLFVRRGKQDGRKVTEPFLLLGPVRYVSHTGERPMSVTWALEHAAPEGWFQAVKVAAG